MTDPDPAIERFRLASAVAASVERPCAFCGIHPENGVDIRIRLYRLLDRRLPVCERCIADKARGASMATAGFRTEART